MPGNVRSLTWHSHSAKPRCRPHGHFTSKPIWGFWFNVQGSVLGSPLLWETTISFQKMVDKPTACQQCPSTIARRNPTCKRPLLARRDERQEKNVHHLMELARTAQTGAVTCPDCKVIGRWISLQTMEFTHIQHMKTTRAERLSLLLTTSFRT